MLVAADEAFRAEAATLLAGLSADPGPLLTALDRAAALLGAQNDARGPSR